MGRWRLKDQAAKAEISIEFQFLPGGRMLHAVYLGEESLLTDLVYRVEGDWIISRVVTETDERQTRFSLIDGMLRLEAEAIVTWYDRVE